MATDPTTETRSDASPEVGKTDAKYLVDLSYATDVERPQLTLLQIKTLNCIEEFVRSRGAPPTRRELLSMLGIRSFRLLRERLDELEKNGFIRIDDATTRGLAVLVPSSEARLKAARPGLAKARPVPTAKREVGT